MRYEKVMLDDKAFLEVFVADEIFAFKRKAILVIPGGGYGAVCSDREGEPIAQAFMAHGFNAFVLHYSVAGEKTFPAQLIQASLAVAHIRDHAEEYGIIKDEVFAVGFSAGGHLAGTLGTMWDRPEIYAETDIPHGYNKPKGVMLIYPVITGDPAHAHTDSFRCLLGVGNPTPEQLRECSVELNVRENSAPAFIAHAADDSLVPVMNSILAAQAYDKAGVPFELHIYPRGSHGFALGNAITACGVPDYTRRGLSDWVANAVRWTEEL